jgi:heme o synthase
MNPSTAQQRFETGAPVPAPATFSVREYFSVRLELTKPRLSFLSVITALVGYLAARPERDLGLFFAFIVGTGLAAAGAAALNQWMERRTDALMERTRTRPIPSGAVRPGEAALLGFVSATVGVVLLWAAVNPLAAGLALATVVSYLGLYTPLKRRSRWATEVGAVSGALPPLIGWAAAEGQITGLGWILFGVLFFWQIPHFMAIAWTYRGDYAKAEFPMLSTQDADGHQVAAWSLVHAWLLVGVSLLPAILGYTTWAYGVAAAVLGAWLLRRAFLFCRSGERERTARQLFFATLGYLPAVLAALVLDRWLIS